MDIDNIIIADESEFEFRIELEQGAGELVAHLKRGEGRRLFVIFNGAVDLSKTQYPYYQRWSWREKFPGNVLYITDPVVNKYRDDKLTLAWYMGEREFSLDQIIAKFVKKVAEQLSCEEHIVAYGSSGGGFASLKLAQNAPDVFAIAINPQTNVLKYHEPAVDRYLRLAWGAGMAELNQTERDRLKVTNFGRSRCLIVQNTDDVFHLKHHFEPFLLANGIEHDRKGRLADGISFLKFRDIRGHGPESIEMVDLIVSSALALAGNSRGQIG